MVFDDLLLLLEAPSSAVSVMGERACTADAGFMPRGSRAFRRRHWRLQVLTLFCRRGEERARSRSLWRDRVVSAPR